MASLDRHDRARRGDNDRRRRPPDGFRLRDDRRFAVLVEDVLSTLPAALLAAVADAVLVVEPLPPLAPSAPGGDEPVAGPGTEPKLAAVDTRARPPRLTVYRRPLEARAGSRMELVEVVREAVGREIADAFGLPDWDDEDR